MKAFSKRQNILFIFFSFILLVLSLIPVLLSNNLLYILQTFLENKIFHRSFEISKWTNTINALIAFPVFFVIFLDTIFFLKLSNKSKTILLCIYAVVFLVCTGIVTSLTSYKTADSDLVSELLLAKECYLQKSFWPTEWYYSTELRTINTQLITAPLFIFTTDLHLIKTISVVLLIPFLAFSLYFLFYELGIKELWMKLLACMWILIPSSSLLWSIVHFGNYYIPHICIAFCFLGLFYGLIYKDYPKKRTILYLSLFYLISFIAGISGIRYVLYFEIPLAVLYLWRQTKRFVEEKKQFNIKDFFIRDRKVKTSFFSLVISGLGYLTNSFILSKFYSYSNWNTVTFNKFGEVSITSVFGDILKFFGYQNNVSVFTPAGIINVLIYIFIAFFIICFIRSLKTDTSEKNKDFLFFTIIMAIFNCYIFTNTDKYIDRYFILPLIFTIPCIILFIQNPAIKLLYRSILGFSFSIIVLTSSTLVYENCLSSNQNHDKIGITSFLKAQDYHYGYASFWNANILTYLTESKIELARITLKEPDDFTSYNVEKWLTPERYYTEDFGKNEKIVFIVSKDEFNLEPNAKIFANGTKVFNDEYYYVFEYMNNQAFKDSF